MKRRLALLLLVVLVLLVRPAARHARAASLLLSFSDASAHPAVVDERLELGGVPARIYTPADKPAHAPGVVLVHGVHHLGIDEPRLERFARALAASGVVVATPLVRELADYQVAPHSVDTVGSAVEALRARLGAPRVGLMGMSFGGGISLLAASDPRFADHVSFVVAVGAHDDLGRVSRFFLDDRIPTVDGGTKQLHAHGYGTMVLVHSHVADFFAPEDVACAREALRLWLWEDRDGARKELEALTPEGRARLSALFGDGGMHDEIARVLDTHGPEMDAVSPHGHLGGLKAHVYLLHGEGDTVIPASETEWLAHDVPRERLRQVLVSPSVEHVELKNPSAYATWELVHFMGAVIAETEATE